MRRDLLILFAAVLLIRLPFLDQAIQGDDVYYLILARNAQADPLHPLQTSFRLQGETVWAAGHTRPPGNAWFLAGSLEVLGGVDEVLLHASYVAFSLLAVGGVYFLARNLRAPPLWSALLFATAPVFMVNGNKLESDVPMLAFWCCGFALFTRSRLFGAAATLSLGAFFGYQMVLAAPILALKGALSGTHRRLKWLAAASPVLVLVLWQLFERLSTGAAPAEILAGYAVSYDLVALERKAHSALALLGHLGWVLSPIAVIAGWATGRKLLPILALAGGIGLTLTLSGYAWWEYDLYALVASLGLLLLFESIRTVFKDLRSEEGFLAAWVQIFFAGALVLFYAGSARYLLPVAPALAIWAAKRISSQAVLTAAVISNALLGFALAKADYDYANAYRDAVAEIKPVAAGSRIWSNAEWGLRHYLGEIGGEPLLRDMTVPVGSVLVSSDLAAAIPYQAEGSRSVLLEQEITTQAIPLRLIGPGSRSGYSSSEFGVLPFGIGHGTIDKVTTYAVGRPEPTLSYLKMDNPDAPAHLLSGFFPNDDVPWRWMGPKSAAILLVPQGKTRFVLDFHIPEEAPAREVLVQIGDQRFEYDFDRTGGHLIEQEVAVEPESAVRIVIEASPSYRPSGDNRELSIVVNGFGFRPSASP